MWDFLSHRKFQCNICCYLQLDWALERSIFLWGEKFRRKISLTITYETATDWSTKASGSDKALDVALDTGISKSLCAWDQEVCPCISPVTESFTTEALQLWHTQSLSSLDGQDSRIHSNQVDLTADSIYSKFWGKCQRVWCLRFIWYAPAFFHFLPTK